MPYPLGRLTEEFMKIRNGHVVVATVFFIIGFIYGYYMGCKDMKDSETANTFFLGVRDPYDFEFEIIEDRRI